MLDAHERLLGDLAVLEAKLAHWTETVRAPERLQAFARSLSRFRDSLHAHFALEEGSGFMAPVVVRAPAKDSAVKALMREHAGLREEINGLAARAERWAHGHPEDGEELRQRLRGIFRQLHDHEERENALVQEVFYGGGEATA